MQFTSLGQQNNISKSTSLKYRLYLALLSQVEVDNFPEAVQATISASPLLPGESFHYVDTLINSINPSSEAGESPLNLVLTLSPSIEGISKETLSWFYLHHGERVIAIYERCLDKQKFIAGSPCSGGLLISGTIGALDNGNAGISLTLTGGECPEPIWFYDGPVPLSEAVAIAADATTFALTDNSQYLLANNTAATTLASISGITDDAVGRIIELAGAGSTFPTLIEPSATFILSNGVNFSAAQGSKISFRIIKTGTSAYAFVEVYRS